MIKIFFRAFVLSSIGLFLFACTPQMQKIKLEGEAQGTYYAITYFDVQNRYLKAQVDSILDAFDQSVSVYQPQSIVSKVNRNEEVDVDVWFENNFDAAERIARLTDGAMDITIGPLANAWGFGTFSEPDKIDPVLIDSLRKLVDYKAVRIENKRLVKKDPRMELNFNAIAQGNSVDVLGQYFQSLGITNYLIDVGGEILGRGHKPDGENWIVGIEKPTDNSNYERELEQTFPLINKAMATSGNYRKYYEIDGVRYAHSIDPKSGYPVQHSLLSVSVLSDNCTDADGFATAFMVMGMEKSLQFIAEHPEIQAYFIYYDKDEGMKTKMSKGFMEMIQANAN